MKIELKKIKVREIVEDYVNDIEDGVYGYKGALNIRPKYQREFVYKDKQRDAVINTIKSGLPLNVLYWVDNGDGTYEVLDGQQRTISVCEYISGKFSINYQFFHNLDQSEQDAILDYELMVYVCEGTNKEKLEWFKTINIAGEKLTDQELRNAIFTGTWLSDAKRYFSKSNCPAQNIASDYLSGSAIRQNYLETVIEWISDDNIEKYMSEKQNDPNANELWLYFNSVITWVKTLFPTYRKEMKGLNWGKLYNANKSKNFDSKQLEEALLELFSDEDVTKKSGAYEYLLTKEEKHLSIRSFTANQKLEAYIRQKGICPVCGNHFELSEMEADHITPWSQGGKTIASNCQMLCKHDNRTKSNK